MNECEVDEISDSDLAMAAVKYFQCLFDKIISMSVLLIVGPKFRLTASHAAPW